MFARPKRGTKKAPLQAGRLSYLLTTKDYWSETLSETISFFSAGAAAVVADPLVQVAPAVLLLQQDLPSAALAQLLLTIFSAGTSLATGTATAEADVAAVPLLAQQALPEAALLAQQALPSAPLVHFASLTSLTAVVVVSELTAVA